MGHPFFITIDLSRVLREYEETNYTMLIDDTKMTIVYELLEWIRWMFSIEHCFYLIHNNSAIHELEDIRILSSLKTFEIKPCVQPQCVHKKVYKAFLERLNLYIHWEQSKVPRIFYEKILLINQKLHNERESVSADETTKHLSTPVEMNTKKVVPKFQPRVLNTCKFDATPSNYEENLLTTSNYINTTKNNEFSDVESCDLNKKDLVNNSTSETTVVNKNMSCVRQNTITSEMPNLNATATHKDSENLFRKGNLTQPSMQKNDLGSKNLNLHVRKNGSDDNKKCGNLVARKHMRPFSMGEILKHLKNEMENQNLNAGVKPVEDNLQEYNNSAVSLEENMEHTHLHDINSTITDDVLHCVVKKRKRIRRHKSKKQKPVEMNVVAASTSNNFSFPIPEKIYERSNSELKPNHIRFNSESESEEEFNNVSENKELDENFYNEKKINSSNCVKTNMEELFTMINEKKETLSAAPEQNPLPENNEHKMDCSPVKNGHVSIENDTVNYECQNYGYTNQVNITLQNSLGCNLEHDLTALKTLKEKFPCPVVIERFN